MKKDNYPGRSKCDFEGCPGQRKDAKMKLMWSPTYLFVHARCVPPARKSARVRGETFGFRLGI